MQLAAHAHNIANVSTEEPVIRGDLVEDIVGVAIAKHTYAANARLLATLAETERSLLDVRA